MAQTFDTYVECRDDWIIIHQIAQHPESGRYFAFAFAIHSTFIAARELIALPEFITLVLNILLFLQRVIKM